MGRPVIPPSSAAMKRDGATFELAELNRGAWLELSITIRRAGPLQRESSPLPASHVPRKHHVAGGREFCGARRVKEYQGPQSMSEQPPDDLGKPPVLMLVAVVLAIIVIGLVVLGYEL